MAITQEQSKQFISGSSEQKQPTTEQIKQVEQPSARPVQERRITIRGFVNSPYLFIIVPMIVGGFYLVNHPELVQQAANNPYATAFVLAVPVAVFAIKLIINFFSVIERWVRLQFERAKQSKRGHFFELVTAVFMFVSVCEAGPFFNDIQHYVLYGALGYITVLAFDLIAVVCIDARRKELAKSGSRSGVYLAGVIICAAVSMVANLYSALLNFQAPTAHNFPDLLKSVAPYVGIMFPVMIVFLAFSRDTEIEVDDAETFKKQQQRRVDFLAARREMLAKINGELEQIDLLKQREFFLKSILFTRKKVDYVIETVKAQVLAAINKEVESLKAELKLKQETIATQGQTIMEQLQAMQRLSREMQELAAGVGTQYQETVARMQSVAGYRDELQASFEQMIGQGQEASARQMQELTVATEKRAQDVAEQMRGIARYRDELRSFFEQRIEQLQGENGLLKQEYVTGLTNRYERDIALVKQQVMDSYEQEKQQRTVQIDAVIVTMNEHVSERIERGFAQGKAPYSASCSTDNADPYGDLTQVAIDYPIVLQWHAGGVRTVSIEEVIRGTGLSPQRVRKAEKEGVFAGTKREGFYRVASVIKWLETTPLPQKKSRISKGIPDQSAVHSMEDVQPIEGPMAEEELTDTTNKSEIVIAQKTEETEAIENGSVEGADERTDQFIDGVDQGEADQLVGGERETEEIASVVS